MLDCAWTRTPSAGLRCPGAAAPSVLLQSVHLCTDRSKSFFARFCTTKCDYSRAAQCRVGAKLLHGFAPRPAPDALDKAGGVGRGRGQRVGAVRGPDAEGDFDGLGVDEGRAAGQRDAAVVGEKELSELGTLTTP